MDLLFLLFIFYGIPISLVILGFRWVLRKEGKKRKAKNFSRYAFLGLFLCLIGVSMAFYLIQRHVFEFNMQDKYALQIVAIQQIGYKDNPVNFYLEIQDLNSGQEVEIEFSTGEGPAFQFYLDPLAKEIIYMYGIDSNMGRSMVIDMSNPPNKNSIDLQTERFENLIFCAEISPSFELILQ